MDTFDDFRYFEKETLLEIVLRSVKGMGDAGVNYMFMMAGDPNRCKPDVHIHRCIKMPLASMFQMTSARYCSEKLSKY